MKGAVSLCELCVHVVHLSEVQPNWSTKVQKPLIDAGLQCVTAAHTHTNSSSDVHSGATLWHVLLCSHCLFPFGTTNIRDALTEEKTLTQRKLAVDG